jgi:beta-lactamase regulating signal transducer with metallopeptidase domain
MMKPRPFWIPEVRDLIGIVVISAMVGMLLILLLRPVTVPDNQMTNILIGGFMTATTAVIQFYFGSSKGSVAKDDTINAIATSQSVAPTVIESPATVTSTMTSTSTPVQAAPAKPVPASPIGLAPRS